MYIWYINPAMRFLFVHILPLLLLPFAARAQDIHWSHVNRQPLYQNPGNTGLFTGDLRLTGNYKDQWRNVTLPFSTFAAGADGKWRQRRLSWGALFFYDQVGDGKFQTMELQLSVSKQLKLTADSAHCISVGLQAGLNYRAVNMSKFYFDNQFNGVFFDPSLSTQETFLNDSRANISTAAGAVYTWQRAKNEQLTLGLAGFNLNRPNQGFYGSKIPRDRRLSLFGIYEMPVNQDWAILPGFSLNFQGKYRELLLGGQGRYTLVNRLGTYRAVDGGIWFRNRDAVIIRAGVAIQNWSVAVSYDTNISKLVPASNLRGGLELSAHYIITRFKPKQIIHRVCPDYI
jgi:type IX secretion system PorP/SprF family membrane protein